MQGDITTWDHADIKAENPSLNVPAGTQIKADGLWMDVASTKGPSLLALPFASHHQTLKGAVEICETAFHTNPMLFQLIAGGSSNPWIQQHDRNDRSELSEPKALYPLLCRF